MKVFELVVEDPSFHLDYESDSDRHAHECFGTGEIRLIPCSRQGTPVAPRKNAWPDFISMPLPIQPRILVSQRAKHGLEACCGASVEFVPTKIRSSPSIYYLMRILHVVNTIDSDTSDVREIAPGFSVLGRRAHFILKDIPPIYLLPPPFSANFEQVTESFLSAVRQAGLSGLLFVDFSSTPPVVVK